MTDIVRVWGSCDKIQVEFKYEGGKQWSCTVPPDLKDGIYVAEFWAQDDQGRIGHWVGFLYMVNGICHFKFNQERYQIWLHPLQYIFDIEKENKRYSFDYKKEEEKEFFFDSFKEEYQIFYDIFNYKTVIEKTDHFNLDFIEEKYLFDFCKQVKEISKNFSARLGKAILGFMKLGEDESSADYNNSFSAKLGKAILGLMKLGKVQASSENNNFSAKLGKVTLGFIKLGEDETSVKNNNSCYQISFSFDKDIYIEMNPEYKIFIKKGCEHWEP